MKHSVRTIFAVVLGMIVSLGAYGQDLSVLMMEATCKITGPGSVGTGFVMGKPDTNDTRRAFYILITADHVLQRIQGDTATLVLRETGPSNTWSRVEFPVQIRRDGNPLWRKHPDVDVAAMFIGVPPNTVPRPLSTDLLVNDKELSEFEIHPGMELMCLGYPFGAEANPVGFPILRSGRIASYPLIPTKNTRTFLFDFTVFRGNSGGPVYFVVNDPTYAGGRHIGMSIRGIIGVVVQERNITETIQELYEKKEKTTPLRLGEVVHASFIKELVETMGFPTKSEQPLLPPSPSILPPGTVIKSGGAELKSD